MAALDHNFCSVFVFKKATYLGVEEYVGGPRRLIMPPKDISVVNDVETLELLIQEALNSYQNNGLKFTAQDWDEVNKEFLEYFEEKSISSYERKVKNVTVRRDNSTQNIDLFGSKNKVVENVNKGEVAVNVMKMLGKPIKKS
mgnify:CR=1 FL=1